MKLSVLIPILKSEFVQSIQILRQALQTIYSLMKAWQSGITDLVNLKSIPAVDQTMFYYILLPFKFVITIDMISDFSISVFCCLTGVGPSQFLSLSCPSLFLPFGIESWLTSFLSMAFVLSICFGDKALAILLLVPLLHNYANTLDSALAKILAQNTFNLMGLCP